MMHSTLSIVLLALIRLAVAATLLKQPVLWEDLADLDVFRVNDTWYYSASTMHYSPGAPILESKDLVNWQYIGHSVPHLDFGPAYDLTNRTNAYVKGVFASSLRRRPSDGQWFWVGCVEYSRSYVYTAPAATGPWTLLQEFPSTCYYDCGLMFDDDMTPYIAHGSTTIHVAKMASDLRSQVSDSAVYTYPITAEGSRMYKIKGQYYVVNDAPSTMVQYVMKASSPAGPYTSAVLSNAPPSPITGGGSPHQGGLVDDTAGNWYYMAFCDSYPGGRVPVLAPITFTSSGLPQLPNVNAWPSSVTTPMTTAVLQSPNYVDTFSGTGLSPQWEWNHNPNISAYSVNNGLTLKTATVTNDFNMARNTLTHRILGPQSVATIQLNYSNMKIGDRAGLVMIRDTSAWIGVIKNSESAVVALWNNITLVLGTNGWSTGSTGALSTSKPIAVTGTIYLRAAANIQPGSSSSVQFSYSTDGTTYSVLGSNFTMANDWQFFMGYRYGIFNHATLSLGGSVQVKSFSMQYAA